MNDALDGDPIGEQHLAVIAGTNSGDEPFAASVAANWGGFPDAPPWRAGSNAPPANKTAILNALIYKNIRRDDIGRPVVLARATMRRRPEATDEAQ